MEAPAAFGPGRLLTPGALGGGHAGHPFQRLQFRLAQQGRGDELAEFTAAGMPPHADEGGDGMQHFHGPQNIHMQLLRLRPRQITGLFRHIPLLPAANDQAQRQRQRHAGHQHGPDPRRRNLRLHIGFHLEQSTCYGSTLFAVMGDFRQALGFRLKSSKAGGGRRAIRPANAHNCPACANSATEFGRHSPWIVGGDSHPCLHDGGFPRQRGR